MRALRILVAYLPTHGVRRAMRKIFLDRMLFTCPCCPYPAHFARCAMHEIDELWLAPVWRQAGSFRMRRFVYTEG